MSQLRVGTEEVRRYLAAVEVELSDLDAYDRRELLADVEEHLSEVAAEHEGPLDERLGDAATYASELRTSAGLPPRGATSGRTWRAGRAFAARLVSHERVRALREFLPELAPGWWILRGYLLVLAFAIVSHSMTTADFPFPRLAGNQFFGVIVAGLAMRGSVALGRRVSASRRARIGSFVASGLVVIMTLGALDHARAVPTEFVAAESVPAAGVRHWDGSEALDLCPYGPDGKLLSEVLVFDQAGRPVTELPRVPGSARPEVMNAYPRGVRVPSADGVLREVPCPKLARVTVSTLDGPSWVEIIVGGIPTYRALLESGQTRTFYGEQIALVIGNAGAVVLNANGKTLGRPGAMGEVYRGVFDRSTKTLSKSVTRGPKPLVVE